MNYYFFCIPHNTNHACFYFYILHHRLHNIYHINEGHRYLFGHALVCPPLHKSLTRSYLRSNHAFESGIGALCFHAGYLSRAGGHPPGFAAAAHASDVAHQRHLGHFGGGRHSHHRLLRAPPRSAKTLGFIAITAAVTNIVSGFLITDRMLQTFQRGEK